MNGSFDLGAAISRDARAELLAAAPDDEVIALAERAIASSTPTVLAGPEVGVITLQVREPVACERFNLAEVLVTRAEVTHRQERGWAMRLGEAPEATLAAAILDAEAAARGPNGRSVVELCERARRTLDAERAAEWAELEPTIVRFEELDR